MSEFSTLNGYKVKDKKAIRFYDNVESMLNDITLKEGMHVKTKGYYNSNDCGGSEYHITSVESQTEYQEELNNGLYATLILQNEINTIQFGLIENTDESVKLQKIFNLASSNHLTVNGLNKSYIVSGTNEVGNNYGLTISDEINLKNIKLKVADSVPDLTCALILDISESDIVNIDNIEIDGNRINQTHSTGIQDGGKHGIRLVDGTLNLSNSIIHDCYTDGVIASSSSIELNMYNCELYGNGRNGITDNSNVGKFDYCYIHENGTRTSPMNGIHVEPDATSTKELLYMKNCKILDNTNNSITVHYNNKGHHLNKIYIDNCILDKLVASLNDDGETLSQIDDITINNSKFNNAITIGFVSSTNINSGLKKMTINNSKLFQLTFKTNYKVDVLLDNCTLDSYIWNMINMGKLNILNSKLIKVGDVPSSDSLSTACIVCEGTHTIDELIVDNCYVNNYSRFTRGNTIEKVSIINSNINTIYTIITGIITLLTLINNKFTSSINSRLASGTITDIIRVGNDFRNLTTISVTDATITESANLTNA